jgi:hypothetical protein
MVKVARTGPRISQQRLLVIVLAMLITAAFLSAYTQRRNADESRLFCANYGATWDGVGCIKPTVEF